MSIRCDAGGPTDAADFSVVSQTCSARRQLAAGSRAVRIPQPARGTCVGQRRLQADTNNYKSVARLKFTSGSDTATENVLLAARATAARCLTRWAATSRACCRSPVSTPAAASGRSSPASRRDYDTALRGERHRTTGDAALTVTDPDTVAGGNLVNGSFSLASPVPIRALGLGEPAAGVHAAATSDGTALSLELELAGHGRWADAGVCGRPIGATEALRAGTYSKTLTFTLSTTTP